MTAPELETILASAFQDEALPRQPHYLIQIGALSGTRLRQAYLFIKNKTVRGRRLDDYPLTIVALTSDTSKVEKQLAGIPHVTISLRSKEAHTITKALEKQGIDGSKLGLFMDFSGGEETSYLELQPHHGIIRYSQKPLLDYANIGLFPKLGMCFCYPDGSLSHLEGRPYTVREVQEGELVLEKDGKIAGTLSYIRLASTDALVQEEGIKALHDPQGPILHILSCKTSWEYEEQFLEYFLQQAFSMPGITHVTQVVACENYPGKDVIGMESYVEELKEEKGSADIATKMHVVHGAIIKKCIPNYRPEDKKNLGYGVLVVYTKGARVIQAQEPAKGVLSFEKEFTSESIQNGVEQVLKGFNVYYSKDKTFEEMGLEYLQLLELRKMLGEEFRIDLPSNLFALYPTPERLIHYLVETKLQPYKEWLYETVWKSTPKPELSHLEPKQNWVIIADDNETFAAPLKELLHEYGQNCVTDLNNAAGVVYLAGMSPKKTLEESHKASIEPLVELVNKMAQDKGKLAPKLYVVTQSMAQDGTEGALAEWPLNALCKIIREEYPKFHCSFISLDPAVSPEEAAGALFDEIRSNVSEPQVAFRNRERLVSQLTRSDVQRVREPTFSPKSSYLIAGGARPLGLLLARWYAAHGAKHIILLDELELGPQAKATIAELEKQGIDVAYGKAPLDDEQAIKQVIDAASAPIQGVIHAAGVVDNDLLIHMNWDRFTAVHRLKVTLSWILHKLTLTHKLDHFILFSSALADVAPLAKANHATGNSFLDALSYYRQKRGLTALTIDWGPWELRHMEVRHLVETSLSDRVKMLRIEEGLHLLDILFFVAKPQIMAALVNWPAVLQGMPNLFFDEIAFELGYKKISLLKNYYQAAEHDRERVLETYLHERVRKLLKLASAQQLEPTRELHKMGLDIQKQQFLKNLIEHDLGDTIKLPFNLIEDSPTLQKLGSSLKTILDTQVQKGSRREVLSEALLNELHKTLKAGGKLPEIVIITH